MSATIASGPYNVITFATTAERLAYVFNGTERGRTIARDMESGVDYQVVAAGSGASCFSSMDASGLLDKTGGTMTGAITWALPTNDDGSVIQQVTPKHAAMPLWYQRLGGATFAGTFDPVMSIGWNVDATGLPVDATYGTVSLSFEGYYKTLDAQEFHIVYGMKNGSAQTRLFTSYGDQTTGYVNGAFNFTQFDFIDQVGAANLLSIATANAAAGARRVTVGPGVGFYVGDGSASSSIVFNNTHSVSAILGDSFQLAALGALPLKLYGSAAGAGSIIARTAMTIGGTGDKATTVANLTLTPEASQTAALLDLSGAAATLPLMKVVATSDTPTGASTTFLKVLVGATPFYIALKAAS